MAVPTRLLSRLPVLAGAACVAIAVWIAIDSLTAMIEGHVALPFWDQWASVAEYRIWLDGNFGLADLFRQHNEHRIAAGRVLFLIDYIAFGGRGIFLSICIAAILVATAALLIWVGRPKARSGWSAYAVVAAAVAACCLTLVASENLLWSFQAPFVLLYLSAFAGLYATARSCVEARAGRGAGLWLALAIAALSTAAFCMANGLAAAGLAIVLALMLGAPWRITAVLGATFALLTAAYFHGYQPGGEAGSLAYLTTHPLALPTYLSMFLGNVLRDYPARDTTTLVLGLIGMGLCLAMAWRILVRRDRHPARLLLTALVLFVLAAGLSSGAGRIEQFGLGQALAPRYVTPGALFWAAQLLYWHSASRDWPKLWMHAVPVAAAAVFLLLLAGAQVAARKDAAGLMASMTRAGDALLVGVRDSKAEEASTPLTYNIPRDAGLLRAHSKSIYAEPEARWMGRPLTTVAKPAGACTGAVDLAAPTPGDPNGLTVTGWAWDGGKHRRIKELLIADTGGRIVGLASGGYYRPDVSQAVPMVGHVATGWNGYALGKPGQILAVFGLIGDGRACLIGRTIAAS